MFYFTFISLLHSKMCILFLPTFHMQFMVHKVSVKSDVSLLSLNTCLPLRVFVFSIETSFHSNFYIFYTLLHIKSAGRVLLVTGRGG